MSYIETLPARHKGIQVKKRTLIISLTIVTTLWSCENLQPLEKKELIEKNPTDHIFNLQIETLRRTIIESFNEHRWITSKFYDSSVFFFEFKGHRLQTSFNAEMYPGLFGKEYFEKEGTQDDIYLYSYEYWASPIYYAGGQSLNCRTAFILKLKKINEEKTLLTIKADNLKVIKGVDGLTAHGFVSKDIEVEPTTVEEYSLILFIAEQLGDTTLKPLGIKTKE